MAPDTRVVDLTVEDLRGRSDLFGRTLRVTTVGLIDQLAAAASLVMGQADEGLPAVVIRGVAYGPIDGAWTGL